MARPNIAAVAYRTRTVCNTVKKKPTTGITIGRAPVPQGLGVTFCGTGTIDGELTAAYRKNAFARTANQRSWWRYWPRRTGSERRNNCNNDSFSRFFDRYVSIQSQCWCSDAKYNDIRLTRTTIQHNGEAGMRENDLYRQRFQQHTEGLALVGLEKGELFVLKKTSGFALRKADFSLWEKRIVSLWEKRDGSF
jgi:hypothetical protein